MFSLSTHKTGSNIMQLTIVYNFNVTFSENVCELWYIYDSKQP